MNRALQDIHTYKDIFLEDGVCEHFNLSKLHSLLHYLQSIRSLGCLDGLNTETSERLHIDYAKKVYHTSNRKEYVVQMTSWLRQQEAIAQYTAYLSWINQELETALQKEENDNAEDAVNEDDNPAVLNEPPAEVEPVHVPALRVLLNSNASHAY